MTVNGGTRFTLSCPERGWDNWTQVPAQLTLKAGWNTLRLQ
ncbi:hypothetical protein ACFKCF_50600 [Nonomuraea sp. JJY05]